MDSVKWSVRSEAVDPPLQVDVPAHAWTVLKASTNFLFRLGFIPVRDHKVDEEAVAVFFAHIPSVFVDRSVNEVSRLGLLYLLLTRLPVPTPCPCLENLHKARLWRANERLKLRAEPRFVFTVGKLGLKIVHQHIVY